MSRPMIADPPAHISSVTRLVHTMQGTAAFHEGLGVERDGICHCTPQPESSPLGECPRCHRLDIRKSLA